MKVRMKFAKTGPLMYVGHLDLLRYFQKTFRRAEVDIAYSQGFSPHQILSFAAPLGIGVTSEGEYMDAEFNSITTSKDMLEQINAVVGTPCIKVLSFVVLEDKEKKAMAAVAGADYIISYEGSGDDMTTLQEKIDAFLAQKEITIIKKTKKSEKEMDIRPLIHQLEARDDGIFMRVTTGSNDNLKPELVIESLCKFCGIEYIALHYHTHRTETLLWDEKNECFAPLDSVGKVVE